MRWRRKDTVAIFIILLIGIILYFGIDSYIKGEFVKAAFDGDIETITDNILKFGNLSYIVFFALIVMECVFAPFPPLILYIAGGTIFGGFISGVIAIIANMLGAGIAFKIAHHYGKEKLMPRIPKDLKKKFDKTSRKYGPLSIFILRFNPLTSSDLFSYLAGFTNMSFRKFLIATGIGLLPTVFAQTYLGEQIQNNPLIMRASIIIGALYFVLFFAAYFLFKNKIKKIHLKSILKKRSFLKLKK
jgi:uncharacterized membrane protein YdjX (TVP38/TMEM64 family)